MNYDPQQFLTRPDIIDMTEAAARAVDLIALQTGASPKVVVNALISVHLEDARPRFTGELRAYEHGGILATRVQGMVIADAILPPRYERRFRILTPAEFERYHREFMDWTHDKGIDVSKFDDAADLPD